MKSVIILLLLGVIIFSGCEAARQVKKDFKSGFSTVKEDFTDGTEKSYDQLKDDFKKAYDGTDNSTNK